MYVPLLTHSDQYSCTLQASMLYFTVLHCQVFVKHFWQYIADFKVALQRSMSLVSKPKATVSFQASTCLYIGHSALCWHVNLSTQQTTKPHTNAAALTPSVSVTSTLPSASSSMSLWMLRMASKLSRAFSSWQRSSSIPHSSEERKKQYIRQVHLNYTIVMLQNLVS